MRFGAIAEVLRYENLLSPHPIMISFFNFEFKATSHKHHSYEIGPHVARPEHPKWER